MKSERALFSKNEVLAGVLRAMHACEHGQAHLVAVEPNDRGAVWCPWCGAFRKAGDAEWRRPFPFRLLDDGAA